MAEWTADKTLFTKGTEADILTPIAKPASKLSTTFSVVVSIV